MALNPFSGEAPGAAPKKKAAIQTAVQGAEAQQEAYKKAVRREREALAPSITAAGDYLGTQASNYGLTSDVLNSAYGLTDPALAEADYRRSLQPGYNQGLEALRRENLGAGRYASGQTATDFGDYIFNTQYNPWRTGVEGLQKQFDPYQAIVLQGTLGSKLADLEQIYGSNQAGVLANKFNQIGAAKTGYFDTIAGANQNATGNLFNFGLQALNTGGQVAGMAMNPAGAAAKVPQYAANTAPVNSASNKPFGWFTGV